MLLFPGFSWPGGMWEGVASHLPVDWTILAPDLPGSGATAWLAADEDGPAAFLGDLVGVCGDRLREPLLCGYSMGGRVAWHLARSLGPACKGVLGVSCAPGRSAAEGQPGRETWLEAWASRFGAEDRVTVLADWDAQPLLAGRERATAGLMAARARGEALGKLLVCWADHRGTRITETPACPSRLLIGGDDETYMTRTAGLADRVVAPDCGHAVPWRQPALVSEILGDMMQGTAPWTRP